MKGAGLLPHLENWKLRHQSIYPLIHQSNLNGMSTGQARRASVLTSACLRASGASPRHSAIFCACSSKRTVRLISGIALDECLAPERYRARVPIFVPIAQSTERECPKLQVAGEIPAGDTSPQWSDGLVD